VPSSASGRSRRRKSLAFLNHATSSSSIRLTRGVESSAAEGAPQRVVVGRDRQPDAGQPPRAVAQRFGATVTQAVELTQHQACEGLRERKVVAGEPARVVGQDAPPETEGGA
jgi:hypothetical protein